MNNKDLFPSSNLCKDAFTRAAKQATPLVILDKDGLKRWLKDQSKATSDWVKANEFTGKEGQFLSVPDSAGSVGCVLLGGGKLELWSLAKARTSLAASTYQIQTLDPCDSYDLEQACLGWALAGYKFIALLDEKPKKLPKLVLPKGIDKTRLEGLAEGTALMRDLVNWPANFLGPQDLARAAKMIAKTHSAKVKEIVGEDLNKKNFPAIYQVGKAATHERAPRLVDFHWGNKGPKITLVGKGIVFDTGGLNLKPGSSMGTMKKDMGGAGQVLGLAHALMHCNAPIQLRVLIAAAENSVASNAYRPQDVIATRKGLSVEIGNTDAEGRLVLADALTLASEDKPDLIIDCATLTGAARVAVGTDIAAMFCNDDKTAQSLSNSSNRVDDPVWRMPLHQPYKSMLRSYCADLNNISQGGYGGAITAALFLEHFVDKDIPWVHLDFMAWNLSSKPGRPKGGEAMGLRALFNLIEGLVA